MKGSLDNLNKYRKSNFDIIIVDGMNLVYKHSWSYRRLKDSKGRETGLLYGVLNFCCKLKKENNKCKIIFLWDTKKNNKKEINKSYKANREQKSDDFWNKVKELQLLLSFYNIYQYYKEGYEADDLAYFFTKYYEDRKVLFISEDKDWKALLLDDDKFLKSDHVIQDKEETEELLGLKIENYNLLKSIIGDKSDNIHSIFEVNTVSSEKTIKDLTDIINAIEGDIDFLREFYTEYFFNIDNPDGYNEKLCGYLASNIKKIKENLRLINFQSIKNKYELQTIQTVKDDKRFYEILKDYEMFALLNKIKGKNK
jgi:hypothetical protein